MTELLFSTEDKVTHYSFFFYSATLYFLGAWYTTRRNLHSSLLCSWGSSFGIIAPNFIEPAETLVVPTLKKKTTESVVS